jgi:hypothetical protein
MGGVDILIKTGGVKQSQLAELDVATLNNRLAAVYTNQLGPLIYQENPFLKDYEPFIFNAALNKWLEDAAKLPE